MNIPDTLKFLAATSVITLSVVLLALYENAKAVPFDLADLGKALIFIATAGVLALLLLVVPKKS